MSEPLSREFTKGLWRENGLFVDLAYDAQDCFKQSLEMLSTSRSQWGRASVLWHWAEAEFLQGDKVLGEKLRCEARDVFTGLNLPLMVARLEADTNKQ